MASKAVTDAVLARISANWTRLPVADVNGAVSPSSPGFLAVEYPVSRENQITVGTPGHNVFREEGALRLVMSIDIGAGLTPYDAWFEELRSLFRGKQFGGVTTWAPSPATTDDRSDQGSFFKLTCAVPYHYDFLA